MDQQSCSMKNKKGGALLREHPPRAGVRGNPLATGKFPIHFVGRGGTNPRLRRAFSQKPLSLFVLFIDSKCPKSTMLFPNTRSTQHLLHRRHQKFPLRHSIDNLQLFPNRTLIIQKSQNRNGISFFEDSCENIRPHISI
jgi:hypothetical protein